MKHDIDNNTRALESTSPQNFVNLVHKRLKIRPELLPTHNILCHPQSITHTLSGINVAPHSDCKRNSIGFVCSSDSKPQKDFNLAVASRRAALSGNASLIANFSS